ncbi:inactive receptor-like protein kinase [Carex littledalei]|uniref:Inactive receptor-like protein kinase n=1 Tax=Carex littledalei TaxID=544730 RepID=A0A833W1R9_9POAL|nr:inactive receptor-like protein kinase [Carex littledalei]
MSIFASFLLVIFSLSCSLSQPVFPNRCEEKCGTQLIPFPFHINSSCGPPIEAFKLSCSTTSSLYLTLGQGDFRIIDFLSSGSLILDYTLNTSSSSLSRSCDRWYANLILPSVFNKKPFFAITPDNILRLYDCEDSSLCHSSCALISAAGECHVNNRTEYGCCYPLSDGSVWKKGDDFSVFGEFGCRGFSSWVINQSTAVRGIEMEWAMPRRNVIGVECADGAVLVNATAVRGGVRCVCGAGFVGDGYAQGAGCYKACSEDSQTSGNAECCRGRFCTKTAAAIAGLVISALFLVGAATFLFVLRQPIRKGKFDPDPSCIPKILTSACSTRQFTYQELNEATKGFEEPKILADFIEEGSVHIGTLDDGSVVAVQKINYQIQEKVGQLLQKLQLLSHISHRNIARIIGFCFESNNSLLIVHEHFKNGTVEEYITGQRGDGLSWYTRINIATEIATALAYLQCIEASPIYLSDLKTTDIFFGSNYESKIAGYRLVRSCLVNSPNNSNMVYDFGCLLVELVTGLKPDGHVLEMVLAKAKEKRFHEVLDPFLLSSKQLRVVYEEVERMGDLVLRLLLSREIEDSGGMCLAGVAKELVGIVRDNMGSSSSTIEISLEETFSNSSLLQMISMSPDSLRV